MVNCKRRVDFCVDMLSRFHCFDWLQGVRRRIPVKLKCVAEHLALDPARLRFPDEALIRCSQKLAPAAPSCVDRQGADEKLRHIRRAALPHMSQKESQNNPGMMLSGIVNMRGLAVASRVQSRHERTA